MSGSTGPTPVTAGRKFNATSAIQSAAATR
jgi:hypothetical protein